MINKTNTERKSVLFATILLAMSSIQLIAQENPYQVIYNWGELPGGRPMGVVTGVQPDPDGEHIWVLERCSANQCAGSDLHPLHKLDLQGNTIKSIGGGLFAWPHGFDMDEDGNLWITEGAPNGDARGEPGMERGMGHQVIKINQEGEVLMRLGEAGVPGDDTTHFNGPAAVLVAPNGEVWVSDGHRGGNNRVMKFSSDGELLLQLGGGVQDTSRESGRFNDPHDLKMDSQGRIFVADRGNNRIQMVSCWTSGPSLDAQVASGLTPMTPSMSLMACLENNGILAGSAEFGLAMLNPVM